MTEPLPQRIDRALAWLAENREGVAAALPLRVGAVTYLPGCLERLDEWVARYRAGELTQTMAQAYVLEFVRGLYKGFNHGQNTDR